MELNSSYFEVTNTAKLVAAGVAALLVGRLLLIPNERVKREAEVRAAYDDYARCVPLELFCEFEAPCPKPTCVAQFLLRSEEIHRRHLLLSALAPRYPLADWRPLPPVDRDTGSVDGTVITQEGRLVAGATVYASSPDRPIGGIVPHKETDASGHFAFHGLRWGHYYIYAGKEAEGYAEERYEFFNRNRPLPKITLGPNNQTAMLTVQLGPKAGSLTGTMTDAVTSAPLSPCTEFRWAADPNNFWSGNGLANGKFRILIPSDTDVLWKVWLDGYKPWYYPGTSDRSMANSLRLMPGRVRVLRIELQPDAAVEKTGCGMPIGTVIQP